MTKRGSTASDHLPFILRTATFVFLFGLSVGTSYSQDPKVPDLLKQIGIDQHLGDQLPLDLNFKDESGRQVALGDYFGRKPVILAMVYYQCPMLCTLVLEGVLRSLNAMTLNAGNDFQVVAVSIDPRETPELAAAKRTNYLKEYHRPEGGKGWHFLTGASSSIEPLAHAVGFRYAYLPEKDQYAHASGIMVITPEGKISRYFFGIEYSPRDLRLGLVGASANRIGTMIDQLLLFCYHYDPADGRYSFTILTLIRAAGILTVILMGGTILLFLRRERRKTKDSQVFSGSNLATMRREEGIELK